MVLTPSVLYFLARAGIWSSLAFSLIFLILSVIVLIIRNANKWRKDLDIIGQLKFMDYILKFLLGIILSMTYILKDMTLSTVKLLTFIYIGILLLDLAAILLILLFRIFFEGNKAYNSGNTKRYPEFPPIFEGELGNKHVKHNSVVPINENKVMKVAPARDVDEEKKGILEEEKEGEVKKEEVKENGEAK